jgi:hypothetical protein
MKEVLGEVFLLNSETSRFEEGVAAHSQCPPARGECGGGLPPPLLLLCYSSIPLLSLLSLFFVFQKVEMREGKESWWRYCVYVSECE